METVKQRLRNGELVLGTIMSEVRNPNVAYMLAQCGFEFFIIDNEHGAYSSETVSNLIAAARGAGIAAIVRIPEIRRETILKPLDSGAAGLLVPQVNTVAQAQEVIHHAKYPPAGNRGVALRRAANRYARVDAAAYLQKANEDTFIAVQAESEQAVENIDAIAAVEGIDCVFVGPFDLSVSLGIPGQVYHPREVEAIDAVLAACRKRRKASGILLFDPDRLIEWIGKGVRFATYSSDISLLADAAATAVTAIKNSVKTQ
jgi:2-keto-3-deoxy-L-rhamnonate aldolase RhmA